MHLNYELPYGKLEVKSTLDLNYPGLTIQFIDPKAEFPEIGPQVCIEMTPERKLQAIIYDDFEPDSGPSRIIQLPTLEAIDEKPNP